MNDESQLSAGQDFADEGIDLGELLGVLLENRWLIIGITTVALIVGAYKAFVAMPVYQADALMQVEENTSGLRGLEVSELFAGDTSVAAEMEILKSRSVMGTVVDNLKLYIQAEPEYMPYIGAALAQRAPASERPGIKVAELEIPESLRGTSLKLVALGSGRYELFDAEELSLGTGTVGELLSIAMQNDESLSILVSELNGDEGQAFYVWRSSKASAIASLQGGLAVSEQGEWSGILKITLSGGDPKSVQEQLNEIAKVYFDKSVERRSVEVQKTLDFLDKQLPMVRASVDKAELALNKYRLEKGSIDLSLETQSILQTVVGIEAQINELQQEREKVTLAFTPAHPTIIALDRQLESLNEDLAEMSEQVQDLPTTQQDLLRLIRDVEANTALYTSLLGTAQELRVVEAGTVGNVRIIDTAELPTWPISPNRRRMLMLSLLLGGFLGVAAAFAKHALKSGVEDPDLIEKQVKVPVYATIAHSERQDQIFAQLMSNGSAQELLATDSPDDLAIESLRNLQTALHFGTLDAKNNCIMIAGPSPGVGKSFISANLAAVLTNNGKTVLLIDGDMRQGHLHKFLGLEKENGLSDLIGRDLALEQVLHATPIAGLTLMPTGSLPPNPAELLFHKRFSESMLELIPRYDHIIIDSPPILAATDATIIGQVAGATMMVIKSGVHPMREIEQSVTRLQRAGVNLRGLVINDVKQSYRYGAAKYAYQYAYKNK
jgi:tyrosine-protein kinase Etk/Wzc